MFITDVIVIDMVVAIIFLLVSIINNTSSKALIYFVGMIHIGDFC